MGTLLEQIVEVMADYKGAAHVKDIASMLVERYPNIQVSAEKLPDKVTAVLARDVQKSLALIFLKKNKNGGLKRGIYRLKRKPIVTPVPTIAPQVSTQFTGKAGESAVISELLFYGFNASAMAVDDGIDVVASIHNKYFHIQVKTANSNEGKGFNFTIKKNSFVAKDSFQTFYIFVIREHDSQRYFNDYLILPSSVVRQYVDVGIIKDGTSLSLRIQKDNRGRYILNAKQDVTISINTFGQLA